MFTPLCVRSQFSTYTSNKQFGCRNRQQKCQLFEIFNVWHILLCMSVNGKVCLLDDTYGRSLITRGGHTYRER